ncbi:hypothetical protein M2271_000824 [Streptomyces sp. LBL]|nr:hypothetical protein [Streptomyces sp. LBL]
MHTISREPYWFGEGVIPELATRGLAPPRPQTPKAGSPILMGSGR